MNNNENIINQKIKGRLRFKHISNNIYKSNNINNISKILRNSYKSVLF
jgi:hypothetical protein